MANPFAKNDSSKGSSDKGGESDSPDPKDPKAAKPGSGNDQQAKVDVPQEDDQGDQPDAQKGATAQDVLGKALNIASQAMVQAAQQVDANPEIVDAGLSQQIKTVMVQIAQIAEAIDKVATSPEEGMTPPGNETENSQQSGAPSA